MYLLLSFISIGLSFGASIPNIPQCQKSCTAVYQPVCGSDKKTYSNACTLSAAECVAHYTGHHQLSLSHTGACKPSHHGHNTPRPHHHTPTYKCGDYCNEEVADLTFCASDQNTYDSQCLFTQAQCAAAKMNQSMYIIHTGQCSPMDANCPMMCDPMLLSPVCSTGNRTYRNPCYLKQAFCTHNPVGKGDNYTQAHNGSCDGSNVFQTRQVDCSQYELSGSIALETKGILAIASCPADRGYVCSVDYRTFHNECSLCRYMSDHHKIGADKTVEVVHDGICPSYTHTPHSHIIFG